MPALVNRRFACGYYREAKLQFGTASAARVSPYASVLALLCFFPTVFTSRNVQESTAMSLERFREMKSARRRDMEMAFVIASSTHMLTSGKHTGSPCRRVTLTAFFWGWEVRREEPFLRRLSKKGLPSGGARKNIQKSPGSMAALVAAHPNIPDGITTEEEQAIHAAVTHPEAHRPKQRCSPAMNAPF